MIPTPAGTEAQKSQHRSQQDGNRSTCLEGRDQQLQIPEDRDRSGTGRRIKRNLTKRVLGILLLIK